MVESLLASSAGMPRRSKVRSPTSLLRVTLPPLADDASSFHVTVLEAKVAESVRSLKGMWARLEGTTEAVARAGIAMMKRAGQPSTVIQPPCRRRRPLMKMPAPRRATSTPMRMNWPWSRPTRWVAVAYQMPAPVRSPSPRIASDVEEPGPGRRGRSGRGGMGAGW